MKFEAIWLSHCMILFLSCGYAVIASPMSQYDGSSTANTIRPAAPHAEVPSVWIFPDSVRCLKTETDPEFHVEKLQLERLATYNTNPNHSGTYEAVIVDGVHAKWNFTTVAKGLNFTWEKLIVKKVPSNLRPLVNCCRVLISTRTDRAGFVLERPQSQCMQLNSAIVARYMPHEMYAIEPESFLSCFFPFLECYSPRRYAPVAIYQQP